MLPVHKAGIVGLLAGCLLTGAGCTTAPRPQATHPEPAAGQPWKQVIQESAKHFYEGKDAALSGDFQCAEGEFQEALDIVHPPQAPPPQSPEVKEFSRSLYDSILRYEAMEKAVQATAAPENPGTPEELVGVSGQTSPADLAQARREVTTDTTSGAFDIPITINEQVLAMVAAFTSGGGVRNRFAEGLARSGRYLPMIRSIFKREGLPEDLAYVAMIESSFKTRAHSRARAHGLWQFIASTGRLYGLKSGPYVDERADPVKATEAAAACFKDLYGVFDDWYLAMAAYDAGQGRVARALERTGADSYWDLCGAGALPRETRLYVPSVIAAALIAKNPAHYGFDVTPETPVPFETVRVNRSLRLSRLAAVAGVDEDELAQLNPELTVGITPHEVDGYELRVPEGTRDAVRDRLAEVPTAYLPHLQRHRVRRGETLYRIARRYHVSTRALAQANNLSRHARLLPRTWIVIPERRRASHSHSYRTAARHSRRHHGHMRTASYRVRQGDTLGRIARRHHVSINKIRRWNNLGSDAEIYPGEHLTLEP